MVVWPEWSPGVMSVGSPLTPLVVTSHNWTRLVTWSSSNKQKTHKHTQTQYKPSYTLPAATWFSPQSLVKGDLNVSGDKLKFSKGWLWIRLWGVVSVFCALWICMIPRPDGTTQLQGIQRCRVWRQCMFVMMDDANDVMLKVCDISTALLIRLCTFHHFPILDMWTWQQVRTFGGIIVSHIL